MQSIRLTTGCVCLMMLALCSCIPENEADQIVLKSIEAHGGWLEWQHAKHITYSKTTLLFDSTGQKESEITQFHEYRLLLDFTGEIHWTNPDDGAGNRIVFDGKRAFRLKGNQEPADSLESESAYNTIISSHFVLFQPWKLLDPGVTLIYEGRDTLEDNTVVDVVRALYGTKTEMEGQDRWWFYFDITSHMLVANMVNHDNRYSYIKNLKYDTSNRLILNHHRKSYFTDSLRNVKYLRAEYFYEDIRLK